ncbi:probable long-chain-alcohol O-fatty-acyltransferase 5 [Spinacia oleracea]|uniref:Probable long-chain-alcohol O-fatty-acyltransferase 5 n=1 Tax=Spinacia oleracea TaxID=3562 RepID=A0A9R0II36_SPIOL|nr:probable long-chain-alcohol O-fatty-acyltransferase 5 [Spinacia oleracea]
MEGEGKQFLPVWSTLLASLCYCYFIASKIPKGKLRFFLFFPSFYLFTIFPLYFSSVILKGVTSYFITYLGNFKLLLFSYDTGPLSNNQSIHSHKSKFGKQNTDNEHVKSTSLLRFIVVTIFPMKIKDKLAQKQKSIKILPLNLLHEALSFTILSTICYFYKEQLHLGLLWLAYSGLIYLFLDVVVGICNKLAKAIIDVELYPPFDEPYLSTSLQDFWSRRWNLMVTDVLRHTIYEPTRAILSKYLSKQSALISSVMAVFLVSGLIHELIFYYLTFVEPTWEVTLFFGLNGLCVILEGFLKHGLGHKLRLHWAISGPITLGLVMGTGYLWFFRPFLRNQLDERIAEEILAILVFVRQQFI